MSRHIDIVHSLLPALVRDKPNNKAVQVEANDERRKNIKQLFFRPFENKDKQKLVENHESNDENNQDLLKGPKSDVGSDKI